MDVWEDKEIVEQVKRENMEFGHLWKEHKDLEKKLEGLNKLRFPTPEEELDRKRIQKLKLKGKDRMIEILKQYRQAKKENVC